MGGRSSVASFPNHGKKNFWRAQIAELDAGPGSYLRRIASGNSLLPELYLEPALVSWLSRVPASGSSEADRALATLARELVTKHRDHWLSEFLSSLPNPGCQDAAQALAETIRANQAGDRERSHRSATRARRLFESAGCAAGALRARVDQFYALSRNYQTQECIDEAAPLTAELSRRPYPALRAQAMLDRATCLARAGNLEGAKGSTQQALAIARDHELDLTLLRAIGFETSHYLSVSDLPTARRNVRGGLGRFWQGVFPPLRAYQFYSDLTFAEEAEGLWHAAYSTSLEALPYIQTSGNRSTEAIARYRLAVFARITGRPDESREQTRAANEILERQNLQSSLVRRDEQLFAMAAFHGKNGRPDLALETLEAIQPAVHRGNTLNELRLRRIRGAALARMGRMEDARKELSEAVRLADVAPKTLTSEPDRVRLRSEKSPLFHDYTWSILEHEKNPEKAFSFWERQRSVPVRGGIANGDIAELRKKLRRASVLSFVQLDDYIQAWFVDDRGLSSHRVELSAKKASDLCGRFGALAANPSSDQQAVQKLSRELYELLIAPVESHLEPGRVLWVEPDGPCSAIPFEALRDRQGRDLLDRMAVGTAPGLLSIERLAAGGTEVSPGLPALIVSDPRLTGDWAETYPHLPDAAAEAREAMRFFTSYKHLAGPRATLATVMDAARHASVLHFAGHGLSTTEHGTLLFAPATSASNVALFHSDSMLQVVTDYRLVVLSACHSAAGDRHGAFNPDSLVQACWRAGVPNVVATRWAVDSGAARTVTGAFYGHLRNGLQPVEALRTAARDMRKDPQYAHPAHWAGFHTFGTPAMFKGE